MRKIIIAALFALTLAGCATTGQYGNFVPAAANQQQIATDAVQQLATLYPPAKTRFELHQATPDAFGLALVNTLIRPVLVLLTLPITLLTLGLFTLVINGLLFWLVASFVHGFAVAGFWSAFLGALVYSVVSTALTWLVFRR